MKNFSARILDYFLSVWIALFIVLWLLKYAIFLAMFFSFALAWLLDELIFKLEKRKCSRRIAALLTCLAFLIAAWLLMLVARSAVRKELPAASQLQPSIVQTPETMKNPGLFFRSQAQPFSPAEKLLLKAYLDFLNRARSLKNTLPHHDYYFVIIGILILILLLIIQYGKRFYIAFLPNDKLEKGSYWLASIRKNLTPYLIRSAYQITITFLLVFIALYLLKIPCFFTWSFFAALAGTIPYYLGLLIGMIPPILTIYFSQMPAIQAGGVLITFAVINLFARMVTVRQPAAYTLQPKFFEIPFLLIIGWTAAQLWGLLLSVPVAIILKVIRKQYQYIHSGTSKVSSQ